MLYLFQKQFPQMGYKEIISLNYNHCMPLPYLLQGPVSSGNDDHVCVFHQFQEFLGLALIICLKYKGGLGSIYHPRATGKRLKNTGYLL